MATQATNDQGQIFETEAGTNTASTADDILDSAKETHLVRLTNTNG